MNYMQKMGIDPNTVEGLMRMFNLCGYEVVYATGNTCTKDVCEQVGRDCNKCKAINLLAEVPKKTMKRWEVYYGKVEQALAEHLTMCKIDHPCTGKCSTCLLEWMMENVEVEDV